MPIITRTPTGFLTVLHGKLYEWYTNERGRLALKHVQGTYDPSAAPDDE